MGAISPIGNTVTEFWENAIAGNSGIDYLKAFDTTNYPVHIAGEVKDFDPEQYMDRREARRMARFSQFAVAATRQALDQAELDFSEIDNTRVGVLLGNGIGGIGDVQTASQAIGATGDWKIDPFFFPKMLPNMAAAHVSRLYGARGVSNVVITACAAGTQAIGDSLDLVRAGRLDVCVTGGTESGMTEVGLSGFAVIKALSSFAGDPKLASRPFDAERDGFVAAEACGILILENAEHAKARNAPILAEVAGFGATNDAFHAVAPCEDGDGAMRAMQAALADAGMKPEDVDYINAHGTSTKLNDLSESIAIKRALGEDAYRVPVSSTKSMIGHSFGAAGAIESVAAIQSIVTGMVHPTINYEHPDPDCDLDYVPNEARRLDVDVVLKNSFGFGGHNACLVFKRFDG
jgi:3-oxoacyl-[acyl-carrier-protein] synthase II